MCGSINTVWQGGHVVHSSLSYFTTAIHHAARVLPAVMNDWWDLLIPSSILNVSCALIVGANFEPMKLLCCSNCIANYCSVAYFYPPMKIHQFQTMRAYFTKTYTNSIWSVTVIILISSVALLLGYTFTSFYYYITGTMVYYPTLNNLNLI